MRASPRAAQRLRAPVVLPRGLPVARPMLPTIGMTAYPVEIHIQSPDRFDRIQLLVRLVIALALGFLGVTAGWIGFALYLVLPAVAAVFISSRGPQGYLDEVAPSLARVLGCLIGFHAYLALVIDRVPIGAERAGFRMEVHPGGHPSVGGALLRLVTSLPAALLLVLFIPVTAVFALIGVVTVLASRTQPEPLLRFQRAVVCYAGRLAGYHAALVETYPPFTLGETPAAPRLSAG